MRIALYQGISLISRLIRWQTRSRYSHAALLADDGSVIEAWMPCVRLVANLSEQHTTGTVVDVFTFVDPIPEEKDRELWELALRMRGVAYDYVSVLRFISRRASRARWDDSVFCSEMVFELCALAGRELLARTEAWRVPPDWISRSPLLRLEMSITTT